ncbi:MAG: 3-methyl-2-oxobutanoate hydroxymethyltransferase [Deltaproteobacteria bacterium]|nr:3-methyl-2-oxobutanoate hydroxymethyltransferase [Deltaproteobacteria bacterium]
MYGKGTIETERQEPQTSTQETSNPQAKVVDLQEKRQPTQAAIQRQEPPTPTSKKRPLHDARRVTVRTIRRMKKQGEKIVMLTAYDATFARLLDDAGVEMLLVGDSLGMVVQGADDTLSVTMEDMIYHTRCVARGARRAMVVGDLPFMSYQISPQQALENAGRLVKEGGAHCVKLEGGEEVADAIRLITRAGIPVVGHLGLTPQSVHALGGFVVQGRRPEQATQIIEDAKAVQAAGACCLVLECIPADLAREISEQLDIPTIGIGAGKGCDGQVLVVNDMLGLNPDFQPRFVKQYTSLHELISGAVHHYLDDVKEAHFPAAEHSF